MSTSKGARLKKVLARNEQAQRVKGDLNTQRTHNREEEIKRLKAKVEGTKVKRTTVKKVAPVVQSTQGKGKKGRK